MPWRHCSRTVEKVPLRGGQVLIRQPDDAPAGGEGFIGRGNWLSVREELTEIVSAALGAQHAGEMDHGAWSQRHVW